jgi:uncharacterized protein YceH (UPF0502 family)
VLTAVEARVVGCLIEKSYTTPDQYPLSLNGLVTACNQSTNRDPVMSLEAMTVETAALVLKGEGYTRVVHATHGRGVTKYRHVADEKLGLDRPELALLGVLLLRGPQTSGELKLRAERLYPFATTEQVEQVLHDLAARDEPLARLMERLPGQKEPRWLQLLAVTPEELLTASGPGGPAGSGGGSSRGAATAERIEALEARIDALETRLAQLVDALGDLVDLPDPP